MGVDELHDGDIHTQATIVIFVPPKLPIAVECRCHTVCASLEVSINSLIRNRRRINATNKSFHITIPHGCCPTNMRPSAHSEGSREPEEVGKGVHTRSTNPDGEEVRIIRVK